jgi:hypothetical protein
MLPDRVFYPLVVLTAALLIALAMVWPQGQGARSPKPFGHKVAPVIVDPAPLRPPAKKKP